MKHIFFFTMSSNHSICFNHYEFFFFIKNVLLGLFMAILLSFLISFISTG